MKSSNMTNSLEPFGYPLGRKSWAASLHQVTVSEKVKIGQRNRKVRRQSKCDMMPVVNCEKRRAVHPKNQKEKKKTKWRRRTNK